MKIFFVSWKLVGQGSYIPEDPCVSSGGYRADKYCTAFITAQNKDLALTAAKAIYPGGKGWKAKLAGEAIAKKKTARSSAG